MKFCQTAVIASASTSNSFIFYSDLQLKILVHLMKVQCQLKNKLCLLGVQGLS